MERVMLAGRSDSVHRESSSICLLHELRTLFAACCMTISISAHNALLCRLLRQELAKEQADGKNVRRLLSSDLNHAQKELQDCKSQLTEQQKDHEAVLAAVKDKLTAERETALSNQKHDLEQEYSDTSNKIIEDWKNHYEGQMADLRSKIDNVSQSQGGVGSSTAQLEAELALAKQQIQSLQKVKGEDSAAEQRAAEAQKQISSLESSLRAAQADLVSSSQAAQQAESDTQDIQRRLQDATDTSETLGNQLVAAKHEFDKTVKDMLLKTAEHARQYVLDLQDARSQHGDHRDSGGRGHKRSRDSSSGRDGKRRS